MVLTGLVISALYGLDTNRTLAYQVFSLFFAISTVSLLWGLVRRVGMSGRRDLPRFATVGQTLNYRLKVFNLTNRLQKDLSIREESEDIRPPYEVFAGFTAPGEDGINRFSRFLGAYRWEWLISSRTPARFSEHILPDIPPKGSAEVKIDFIPLRRGRLILDGLNFSSPDPFGLFRTRTFFPIRDSVLVLPRRYDLPSLSLPGQRRHNPHGVALASSVGDSQEFSSMRDYRPGDPLRRIHWKSWAKAGKPIVKEYQEEFFVRHALILDTFGRNVSTSVFEEAVSVAASFAASVRTQDSLLDLMFVGPEAYCFTSGRGLGQADGMLEVLASVQVCRDKKFEAIFPLILGRVDLLSSCICVFLDWDPPRKQLLTRLRALGLPVKVLVVSAETEQDLGPMSDQPQNFHVLVPGKIEEGLARI